MRNTATWILECTLGRQQHKTWTAFELLFLWIMNSKLVTRVRILNWRKHLYGNDLSLVWLIFYTARSLRLGELETLAR